MSDLKFNKKCPNCESRMANNNRYCCLKCFKEKTSEKMARGGVI